MSELKPCKKGHNPEVNKAYGAFCVSCSGGLVLHEETNYYKSKQAAIDDWNKRPPLHEEAENLRDILQRAMYILRDDYEQGKYSSFINEIVEVFARLDMFPYTDWIKQRVKNDN